MVALWHVSECEGSFDKAGDSIWYREVINSYTTIQSDPIHFDDIDDADPDNDEVDADADAPIEASLNSPAVLLLFSEVILSYNSTNKRSESINEAATDRVR